MTYGRGIDGDCPKISSEALSTNNPMTINFLVPYVITYFVTLVKYHFECVGLTNLSESFPDGIAKRT